MDELTADYASGALQPADVKSALAKAINEIFKVLSFSCIFKNVVLSVRSHNFCCCLCSFHYCVPHNSFLVGHVVIL
jgi:hypothetical protein